MMKNRKLFISLAAFGVLAASTTALTGLSLYILAPRREPAIAPAPADGAVRVAWVAGTGVASPEMPHHGGSLRLAPSEENALDPLPARIDLLWRPPGGDSKRLGGFRAADVRLGDIRVVPSRYAGSHPVRTRVAGFSIGRENGVEGFKAFLVDVLMETARPFPAAIVDSVADVEWKKSDGASSRFFDILDVRGEKIGEVFLEAGGAFAQYHGGAPSVFKVGLRAAGSPVVLNLFEVTTRDGRGTKFAGHADEFLAGDRPLFYEAVVAENESRAAFEALRVRMFFQTAG